MYISVLHATAQHLATQRSVYGANCLRVWNSIGLQHCNQSNTAAPAACLNSPSITFRWRASLQSTTVLLYWSGAKKKKKKKVTPPSQSPFHSNSALCSSLYHWVETINLQNMTLRLFDPKTLQCVPGLISEYDLTVSHFHKQTTAIIKCFSALISLKAGLNLADEVNRAPKWVVTLTTAIISGELLSISSNVAALPLWNETSSNVNWKGNSFQSTPAQLLQMQICIEVVYDLCPMFSKEALNSHICKQLLLQRPNYLYFFWVIYEKFRILDTMCRSLKEEKKLITCNSSAYFCDFSHFDNLKKKKVHGSVSFQMIAIFELHFRCIFAHWPSHFGREISIYLNE